MSKKLPKNGKAEVRKEDTGGEKYVLKLYVTGLLPNSVRAILNVDLICERYLKGRYELEIIDIYKKPSLALEENIIAVPVLVKKLPLPEERLIGDLSNIEEVLKGLHLI